MPPSSTFNSGNQLVFATPPDFENPTDSNLDNIYQVQVTASDGHGGTAVQNLSVTVTNVPDSGASLDANGNLVVSSGAGQNDAYQLSFSGNSVVLNSTSGPLFSSIGTGIGTHTLVIDRSSFAGKVIVNTGRRQRHAHGQHFIRAVRKEYRLQRRHGHRYARADRVD